MMDAVARSGAVLLPIDSEHNAIFQCLPPGTDRVGVESVVLTASGGPFLNDSLATMASVTPEQACAHPNWVMGPKISVDSATLMNKGLELIEACWLFDLAPERIEVVIHPQSVIHSMVRYLDGSVIAQLGEPDMRTPIAYGLAWPERIQSGAAALDFSQLSALTFSTPDHQRFPCLSLAAAALRAGPTVPVILNAANEVAVASFLAHKIRFTDIADVVAQTLDVVEPKPASDLSTLFELDRAARQVALLATQQ
jgi:1-deoxy-D-xylulose-5-phosphate reductoisomerase